MNSTRRLNSFFIRDILGLEVLEKTEKSPEEQMKPFRTISMEKTPIDECLDVSDLKPHRCSICSMFQDRGKLKPVEMDSEKLILIVGFVLKKKMTKVKARELIARQKGVLSCNHHFSDVFHDIRKSLKLKNGEKIRSVSGARINEVMRAVHSIRPEMKASNFLLLFELSAVLNKHRIFEMSPIEINIDCAPPVCIICLSTCENLRELNQGSLRLIVTVAQILAKKWTRKEAMEILTSSDNLLACHSHFLEIIDLIFDSLGIENENLDLMNEANVLIQVLMKIVNSLCPGTTCDEFVENFRQFYSLNKEIDILKNVKTEPE